MMNIKIFSFPFNPSYGGFDTTSLEKFCLDKEVMEFVPQFFVRERQAYWTVWIRYREPDSKPASPSNVLLSERDQLLRERLRSWRSAKAKEIGQPPFVIFNDKQMYELISHKVITKEGFGPIVGFGQKRISKYGKDIINIIKAFVDGETRS